MRHLLILIMILLSIVLRLMISLSGEIAVDEVLFSLMSGSLWVRTEVEVLWVVVGGWFNCDQHALRISLLSLRQVVLIEIYQHGVATSKVVVIILLLLCLKVNWLIISSFLLPELYFDSVIMTVTCLVLMSLKHLLVHGWDLWRFPIRDLVSHAVLNSLISRENWLAGWVAIEEVQMLWNLVWHILQNLVPALLAYGTLLVVLGLGIIILVVLMVSGFVETVAAHGFLFILDESVHLVCLGHGLLDLLLLLFHLSV